MKIHINTDEKFPHLESAPIVEAVIDLRAQSIEAFDEAKARAYLEPHVEGYKFLDSQQELNHQIKIEAGSPPQQTITNTWKGVRFRNLEGKNTAHYNRDGFVFSRLAPYQHWAAFSDEAMRLWRIFKDMAKPETISRIGLRFINRIELPAGDGEFERFIDPAPKSPRDMDLPFFGFMHQESFAVPDSPYAVNLIRTIQPPIGSGGFAIIIDIDVFTLQGGVYKEDRIMEMLEEMRWLKNKTFFGSVTDVALEVFKC